MYLGDDGTKELIIFDHVHFVCKNQWTQDCSLSPKGQGRDKTHVTQKQEMKGQ